MLKNAMTSNVHTLTKIPLDQQVMLILVLARQETTPEPAGFLTRSSRLTCRERSRWVNNRTFDDPCRAIGNPAELAFGREVAKSAH
jgi:hypothetical protein